MNCHSSPNARSIDPQLQLLAAHLSATAASLGGNGVPANELLGQHMLLNSQQQLEMMNMFAASRAGVVKPVMVKAAVPLKNGHSMDMVSAASSSHQQQQQLSNFQNFIAAHILRNSFHSNAPSLLPGFAFSNFSNSNLVTLASQHHQQSINNQAAVKRSSPPSSSSSSSEPPAAAAAKSVSKRFDYSKLAQECASIKNEGAAAARKSFAGDHFNASGELKSSKKTSKR